MTPKFDSILTNLLKGMEDAAENWRADHTALLSLTEAYTRVQNLKLADELIQKYSALQVQGDTSFATVDIGNVLDKIGSGKKN